MNEVLTVLLAGGAGERLSPLTREHCKPAIPFGGIYRLVDIPLSNCINSGLYRICVLTQHKALSLNRHIRQAWHFLPPELGAFVETLPPMRRNRDTWYLGTADAVYQNMATIADEAAPYTLILSADHVYKMDYREMVAQHVRLRADVTLATTHIDPGEANRFGIVTTDDQHRITAFTEKPPASEARRSRIDPSRCMASLGIYLFSTPILLAALLEDAEDANSGHDFGHDVLPKLLPHCVVGAYDLSASPGGASRYWRDVGTLDAYFEANMDLLGRYPPFTLDDAGWPLRAAMPALPPARFALGDEGETGTAVDSLVSPGCVVEGGRVARSVLSPRVRVKSHSWVEESVVLSNVSLGHHCHLRRCIVGEDLTVPDGFVAGIRPSEDRRAGHCVTDAGVVVIHAESPGIGRLRPSEPGPVSRLPTPIAPSKRREPAFARVATLSGS